MASIGGGSKLAFFSGGAQAVNLGLTVNGTVVPPTVAGSFNIEVFTSNPAGGIGSVTLAPGYQAAVYIDSATAIPGDPNEVIAGNAASNEQLGPGSYVVLDHANGQVPASGGEFIQVVGAAGGGSKITVIGSRDDTMSGSSVAGNTSLLEANPNAAAIAGPMTLIGGAGETDMILGLSDNVVGGAGPSIVDGHTGFASTITGGAGAMTIYGAGGDAITGGAGAILLNENQGHSGQEKITGGGGNLQVFDIGKGDTISGSTGGTTSIDDSYGFGGISVLTGGSGTTGTVAGGGNTFMKTAAGDTVTGGTDLTLIDATSGNANVTGGAGTVTGAIAGFPIATNTIIEGGKGDKITGGAGATAIDVSPGSAAVTGGAGSTTVIAGGGGDKVTGGAGFLEVIDPSFGGGVSITGGAGNLDVFDVGKGSTITGSTAGWSVINDAYLGAPTSAVITAGTGTTTVPALFGGIAANNFITGGPGDTINGSSGSMFVNAAVANSITGGSGAATVNGADKDTIVGGTGTLAVNITATNPAVSSSIPGSGNETINLGAGHGVATLRDVDVSSAGTTLTGATNLTTVTGFAATDVIASGTSDPAGTFLGTSVVVAGNTQITFLDGSKMTLVGFTGAVTFTK
jgi:hypothetical protein